MDTRERLHKSVGQLPDAQRGLAMRILAAFADEDLDALAALVESQSFGWAYVVESFLTKTKALIDGDEAALQEAQNEDKLRFAQQLNA